jgi:hypothetical protein
MMERAGFGLVPRTPVLQPQIGLVARTQVLQPQLQSTSHVRSFGFHLWTRTI